MSTMSRRELGRTLLAFCTVLALAGCSFEKTDSTAKPGTGGSAPTGGATASGGSAPTMDAAGHPSSIVIDGSSTVYPISQAVAEEFKKANQNLEISVGLAGTGGGFKKFAVGELDICDASRPIRDSEKEACEKSGIQYLEIQIAVDALTVAVNPKNDWCTCLSVSELKRMWEPNSKVSKWNDVNPAWPDAPIKLYGADVDSGTFDYFTEVIVGKAKQSRTDYTSNSIDNVLVQGVADDKYALGYFGYGYYAENQDRLRAVAIKSKDDGECVLPTAATALAETYTPLARPLFIYISKKSLKRPEVVKFVEYYLSDAGQKMVTERKFLLMVPSTLEDMRTRFKEAIAQ